MTKYHCQYRDCLNESGHSIVCDFHRKQLKGEPAKRMLRLWRDLVILKGQRNIGYECFHCGKIMSEEEAIGDHFPYSKGSQPRFKYDVRNGVCCCFQCNNSGSNKRKSPTLDDFKPFL